MILFQIEPPSLVGVILFNVISLSAFFLILFGMFKSHDRLKKIYGSKKTYSGIAFVTIIAFIWLPLREFVSTKYEFYIWRLNAEEEFVEYKGSFEKLKYGTSGVRVYFHQGINIYFSTREDYCFSLSPKSGFDENKKVYMKYIGFGESESSAKCIVYIEQPI